MSARLNSRCRLAARPVGLPKASGGEILDTEVLLRLFRGENTGKLVLAV
jgi:hypothetical protein